MFLYTVSYFGIWLKKRIQYDHHKILVLSDVNLPFHLLTQVSTLGISCLNLDHQLVWQTTCKNALQPWGISTLTSSQLFDIKNSCKLIPINFKYNCTHQDISIQMQTPQLWGLSFFTCMEVLFSLWHASYKMTDMDLCVAQS